MIGGITKRCSGPGEREEIAWRKNVIGIHESSQKALRIMQVTTIMVVILIAWCLVTILQRGFQRARKLTHARTSSRWAG